MTLIRWEPFREIDALQKEMNRLFDRFTPTVNGEKMDWGHIPVAEIIETADALELKVEVPGMDTKDLNIEVTADNVSISGERKSETKTEDKGITRSEFRYGKFHRVIPLPMRVENTNVKAEYKDGILLLNLPKAEEEKNKVVKVNLS